MRDPIDCLPHASDDTHDVIADAAATLAWLRGLDHDPDPAVRLHLLASLHHQLQIEITHATLIANDRGYTPDQIALLIHRAT